MNAEYKKMIEWSKEVMPEQSIELQQILTEIRKIVENIKEQAEKKLSNTDLKDLPQLGKYYAL